MPIKFDRETSTHLFKFITAVNLHFNPFDARTTSIRELMRQVQAQRYAKANPRLKVNAHIHHTYHAPIAKFNFIDGTETSFETYKYNIQEMMFQIHLKAMQLDAQYEMDGKNIDEMTSEVV